ncbi:membrane protein insertase YidC [bacterium]|nr:membrane protein insertase YidC [bacterium]
MDKNLLLALMLTFVTFLAVRSFWSPSATNSNGAGESFVAPISADEVRPLNREIDFVDKKVRADAEESVYVENDVCGYTFSNFGGVLTELTYKSFKGKSGASMGAKFGGGLFEKEDGCFLIALEEKTPFLYKLVSKTEDDLGMNVVFETEANGWTIQKNYRIASKGYKVELDLKFTPKSSGVAPMIPRIFCPGSFVGEVPGDKLAGFALGIDGKKLNEIQSTDEERKGWKLPGMFGVTDKYFINGLIGSSDSSFVNRAFMKRSSGHQLAAVLEGKSLEESTEVKLSFYMGPKLVKECEAVDDRLDGLISLGWFSSLGRLVAIFLDYLFSILKNYGAAIVVLSLMIRFVFLPLNLYSRRRMARYQAFDAKYKHVINGIKTKYRDNQQKQTEELFALFKQHGVSPADIMFGFIPMLEGIPFLIAMYGVLGNHLPLYQAPFFGWITDLSSPDKFYAIPILMAVAMVWSQKILQPGKKSSGVVAMLLMPAMMLFFFSGMPAGLVLFFAIMNSTMVLEEYLRIGLFGKA